ncbi:MAG: ATP-binding protein, partial [Gallionella sp.]|nr:ATP-binding protein [Gallionella sp.]
MVSVIFCVLAITFAAYVWSEKQVNHAIEQRHLRFLLADELRQSSDDLTRMVRTYVVTGDPIYKKHYQDILDIREGKIPRPDGYQDIYRDMELSNAPPHSGSGQAIALLELMRQAGFTDQELAKLAQAKANSDGLTTTELLAMKLIETTGTYSAANHAQARMMLYDAKYHQAKAAIMKPIAEYYQLAETRTRNAVLTAENHALILRIVLITTGLILLILILRTNTFLTPAISETVGEVTVHSPMSGRPGIINCIFFAMAIISVAAALRIWPLQALGVKLVWLTFYPAVMLVSLYGGLLAGLMGTALACLIAIFLGQLLVGAPFIDQPADWLGMAVFVLTGTMISSVSEAMLRANARAKEAQNLAEAANVAKSAFLANMSHELRTPLNAILGFSSLMRRDSQLSKSQQFNLDIINRSGQHLLTQINDILEMAKIEAGRIQLKNAPFDLGGMVRDVMEMMNIRAREKNLRLLLDQSSKFPRYILGDEARLRQVLINLVGNAIKFSEQGGVTVRLGTREDSTSHLIIEVEDSGSGITPEDQQRLFQPFVQLGKHPGDNKGTGLGLAITQQFVRLMGGSIRVESTPGKGSLFRVELPLSKAKGADITQSQDTEKVEVAGLAPGQPEYRILIVEDQLENQLLLTQLMKSIGLPVKVAENGAQAVDIFQSWSPHLIWMDRR